jgi:hypothetical protein
MDLKRAALAISLIVLPSCGDQDAKDDKAKQAVKEAITREFQYYEGAKEKLGGVKKQEEQRRDQEKQLE